MAREDMILGQITDESIAIMRRRIGFPNPALRPMWLSKYVEDVQVKTCSFGGKSIVGDNGKSDWNDEDVVLVRGTQAYVHIERWRSSGDGNQPRKKAEPIVTNYLTAIDAAFGTDTGSFWQARATVVRNHEARAARQGFISEGSV